MAKSSDGRLFPLASKLQRGRHIGPEYYTERSSYVKFKIYLNLSV